jgi:catechol 2,3-dioxygenase-like lactoylglutathione lyase family enzyme
MTSACSALIRATLFVRDLERSTAFYGAMGLTEVYYEGLLEDPSASALIGFDLHWPYPVRILKTVGPNFGMVGLFQLDSRHEAEVLPPAAGPARIGEAALIFYVARLDEAVLRLTAAGASWLGPKHIFRLPHRAQAEISLRDPDGVLVNLIERDPAEQNLTAEALSAQR